MPKDKHSHKGSTSDLFKKPCLQAEDANNKKKQQSKIQSVSDAPKNVNEISTSDPASAQNVLKCFMKHQNATIESVSKQFIDFDEKLQKTNAAIAEKKKENEKLKKHLLDVSTEVQEISKHCKELIQNQQKMEQECSDNIKKYSQLEICYDRQLSQFNATLGRNQENLTALQKQNADLQEELNAKEQQKKRLLSQYETMIQHKENQLTEEQMKCTQLQAHIIEMDTAFKQEKLQLIEQKERAEAQNQAEQAIAIAKRDESAQREAALLSRVKELEDFEKRNIELQKLNQQLSIEASSVTQRLETEKEQQKLKLEELFKQNQDLQTDEKIYQTEIRALKEANEQMTAKKAVDDAAAQNELSKRDSQLAELKQKIEELQQKHLNTINTLSAERDELTQQLQALKPLYEDKLAALQEELKQKNADIEASQKQYTELDRQSNATIAELKYRMTSIGKHIYQPVGTASVVNRLETNDSIVSQKEVEVTPCDSPSKPLDVNENSNESIAKIAANIAKKHTSVVNEQRKQSKRPKVTRNWYNSDFATDSDTEPEWQPKQPKIIKKHLNGNGNDSAKRQRGATQATSDAFDKIKKA